MTAHRTAKTSQCRDPGLEQEMKERLRTDPDNVQLMTGLVTLLLTDIFPVQL